MVSASDVYAAWNEINRWHVDASTDFRSIIADFRARDDKPVLLDKVFMRFWYSRYRDNIKRALDATLNSPCLRLYTVMNEFVDSVRTNPKKFFSAAGQQELHNTAVMADQFGLHDVATIIRMAALGRDDMHTMAEMCCGQ